MTKSKNKPVEVSLHLAVLPRCCRDDAGVAGEEMFQFGEWLEKRWPSATVYLSTRVSAEYTQEDKHKIYSAAAALCDKDPDRLACVERLHEEAEVETA